MQAKGVQPTARRPHAAQNGWNVAQHKIVNLLKTLRFFVFVSVYVFNVWAQDNSFSSAAQRRQKAGQPWKVRLSFRHEGELRPDWCGPVGWAASHKVRGRWFDSQSGHVPGLWVRCPVGEHTRGN